MEENLTHEEARRQIEKLRTREAELKNALAQMKKLDQMKEEFISIISHELRTPLTSIKEAISLLIDEVPGKINEDQREFLFLIKHDTERLNRLLNDILDLSRIEAGKVQMNWEYVDIGEVIAHSVASMRSMANIKNIELSEDVAPELPKIRIDRNKIEQVLSNLLSNAIKFSPDKSNVVTKAEDDGEFLRVAVIDNGIGIPAKAQAKLFDKFYQVDSTSTRKFEGTGLGLSIVKGLVESHKGRIWVESEMGKGSKFIFTLLKKI